MVSGAVVQSETHTDLSVTSCDEGEVPRWITFKAERWDDCSEEVDHVKNTVKNKINEDELSGTEVKIDITKSNINVDCVSLDGSTLATTSLTDDDLSSLFAGNATEENFIVDPEVISLYEDEPEVSYMVPTPKSGTPKKPKIMPITVLIVKSIGAVKTRKIFKVLLDSGSTTTLIHEDCLPKLAKPVEIKNAKRVSTLAGEMNVRRKIKLRDLRLPEFDNNRKMDSINALIFEKKCRYDIILGSDFLEKAGMTLCYLTRKVKWFEEEIPFRDPNSAGNKELLAMADSIEVQHEDAFLGEEWIDSMFANPILDARYEKADLPEIVSKMSHLDFDQRQDLLKVLQKHAKLFDGTLGVYPNKKFHIEIEEGAKPVHSRPYAVPIIHHNTFKQK